MSRQAAKGWHSACADGYALGQWRVAETIRPLSLAVIVKPFASARTMASPRPRAGSGEGSGHGPPWSSTWRRTWLPWLISQRTVSVPPGSRERLCWIAFVADLADLISRSGVGAGQPELARGRLYRQVHRRPLTCA